MGAREIRPVSRHGATAIVAAAALALGALAGCGEEEPEANVSETETLGPASAEGDLEQSSATLRAEDGFTTLASTQITTRGETDTLVAAQIQLPGQSRPKLRLKVDGKPEGDAEVEFASGEDGRTAVVSCACKLPTGEHTIVFEGAAGSGSEKVGARTLVAFTEIELADAGAAAITESTLETDDVPVTPEGETLAEASAGEGSGPALVLVTVASPRSNTGADNVRLAVTIGGDAADQLARTTIPGGKIDAYFDPNGAGKEVLVRGYTTSGHAPVGAASIMVCNCELARKSTAPGKSD